MNNNDFYSLIAEQNHRNNQFNTKGEKLTVLTTFRNIYGYPSEYETRYFLAVSDRNTPVFIVQEYEQPIEKRPADIVKVYEISSEIVNQPNIYILRQFVSDLLFGTHSTKLNADPNVLIQTWVLFIEIAKCNKKIRLNECIHKLGGDASEDVHEVCQSLNEDEITIAFYIMNSLHNTTNDRIKAFEIARLNFDKQVKFSSAELLSALQSLPECDFKIKGFSYLAKTDNTTAVTEYIMNNSNIQQSIFENYIQSIYLNNTEDAQKCRLNLNPYNIFNITIPDEQIIAIIPSSLYLPFDIMIEILIVCLIFYSNECCTYFINAVKKELRVNQTFRHSLMMYIHNSKQKNDMLQFLLDKHKISNQLSLFTPNYNNEYIHDAYFLGFIQYTQYKRASNDFDKNCDILIELATASYENNDGYLKNFINSASHKIRKCVLTELKYNVVSSINNEIHNCFKKLFSLYKKKFAISRNIRKMKK